MQVRNRARRARRRARQRANKETQRRQQRLGEDLQKNSDLTQVLAASGDLLERIRDLEAYASELPQANLSQILLKVEEKFDKYFGYLH